MSCSPLSPSVLSHRLSRVKPSPTVALTARCNALKKAGKNIINFGVGEPDFDTPKAIAESGIKAIERGNTRYTAAAGILELRRAIVQKFKRDNALSYDVEQVTVGVGAKQIIFNTFCATINAGDEVIIPAPYWVSYADMVLLFGGRPVTVACTIDQNFKITPQQLEDSISPKTKWFVFNNPSNPTGIAYSRQEVALLAEVLQRHPHVHILSDDIYESIVYDKYVFTTMAQTSQEIYERTVTVNGVSKTYCMTGWRLGYAAGPIDIIKGINTLNSQSTSCPATMAQWAAVEALDGDKSAITEHNIAFTHRRNFVVAALNALEGVQCMVPNGAFYVYPCIRDLMGKKTPAGNILLSDTDFVTFLLETQGVAVLQGEAFGLSPYIRLSFATSMDTLKRGIERIARAIQTLS